MRAKAVERLIASFCGLPGIGPKTAERLTFFLLRGDRKLAAELADAIVKAKEATRVCSSCFNLDESDPCRICTDPERDQSILMVVEDSRDLGAFEGSGYHGLYHVLQGRVSVTEGVQPKDLTIEPLLQRVAGSSVVREICLATNPDLEGEATARMLQERLASHGLQISRLARGLPAGASIHQASQSMLADAIEGRRVLP